MPKFIRLTPSDENCFETVYVNRDSIECIFEGEDGAHITFIGGFLDVKESAAYVKTMAED